MSPCNTCLKAGSKGVYFPFKTKKHYEVNKTVPTTSTDPLVMVTAPKKDANHQMLTWLPKSLIYFLYFHLCTYCQIFAEKQERQCA